MKSHTRKTGLMLSVLCLLLCVMTLIVFTPKTSSQVKADDVTLGETKFSVSKDEDSIVFVTPIVVDETELARIYEVGYTFDGEQPTVINGPTDTYYTALVTGGNTLTAADIFGDAYEKTTPMIIWEVERLDTTAYSATAYYKQGTIVEGTLYKDYNGVPDVAVEGSEKSTSVYEEVKAVEPIVDNFINTYPQVSLENFVAMTASIDTVDAQLATLSETQKASVKNIDKYNELKSSFKVIENARGTASDRIGESKLVANNGFAGISGVDTVAESTAALLTHPTYGPVLSMGTNANSKAVITFKNKADMDLSGYDYVMFGVRNSRNLSMSVVLYDENGEIVKTLKSGIGNIAYDGTYPTVVMTVEEFMAYDIGFVYAETPSAAANTWLTSFIAANLIEEEIKAVETIIDDFINTYPQVSLENFVAMTASIDTVDAQLATLSESQKASVKNIDKYNELKSSFKVIENARGTASDRIGESKLVANNGFAGISGVDTVAESTAALLTHPTYGPVLSMGTNANSKAVITFKNKADMDLSGYDYVMFGVRNSRNLSMSVVLYDENGEIVKTLKSGIGNIAYDGTYPTVVMTVEEFMAYDIGFVYDETPSAAANTWLTSFIAAKSAEEEV